MGAVAGEVQPLEVPAEPHRTPAGPAAAKLEGAAIEPDFDMPSTLQHFAPVERSGFVEAPVLPGPRSRAGRAWPSGKAGLFMPAVSLDPPALSVRARSASRIPASPFPPAAPRLAD